ncbi:MAG: DUF2809 domain-containing protein [Clostridia bacterium]|nr:DUF2809 domain-containing protein [Clostridia bacterium]
MGSAPRNVNRDRLIYAGAAVLLLACEILIGLFAHDSFIRPYFGDTLVVILLWALIRTVIPQKAVWLSGAIFLFAVLVELSQLIPLADLLGIENRLIRTLMGTSFAIGDIIAYAVGCLITFCIDLAVFRRRKNKDRQRDG